MRDEPIQLNAGHESIKLKVANLGDRPVQVGSHYHFFEVNRCLRFSRNKAFGRRLDIPSGTSVRFEPGEVRTVSLIRIGGRERLMGFNGLTMGAADDSGQEVALLRLREEGFEEGEGL